MTKGKIEYTT